MSKRKHRNRTDALSIERREWYASLQRPAIEEVKYYDAIHRREQKREAKDRRRQEAAKAAELVEESSDGGLLAVEGGPMKQLLLENGPSSSLNEQQLLRVQSADTEALEARQLIEKSSEAVAQLEAARKGALAVDLDDGFNPNSWISFMNTPRYTRAFVVCFPPIGCSHLYYNRWAEPLAEQNIQLIGVCLPGRMSRVSEYNFKSIDGLAIAIFKSLVAAGVSCKLTKKEQSQLMPLSRGTTVHTAFSGSQMSTFQGSFSMFSASYQQQEMNFEEDDDDDDDDAEKSPNVVFFGHDVGTIIAYEVARLLNACKYRITAIIASGACSPYLLSRTNADPFSKKHCFLPMKELLLQMIELDLVPRLFLDRKDLLRKFVPLFRSDYYLMERYKIHPPYVGKVIKESELVVEDPSLDPDFCDSSRWDNMARASGSVKSKNSAGSVSSHNNDNEDDEYGDDDTSTMPVTLFRLRIPILTIRSEEDSSVTKEEVDAWESLSSAYESVVFDYGSHGKYLNLPENAEQIFDILTRFADYDAS